MHLLRLILLLFLCFQPNNVSAERTTLTSFFSFCSHVAQGLDDMNKQNREELYNNIEPMLPETWKNKKNTDNSPSDTVDGKEDKEQQKKIIGFDNLAGKIPEDVKEILLFLKDPSQLNALGISEPRGILLVGPPGNGKTSIARAIAGECNASFFSATGSEFIEMYVGVGPKRIRELFEKARNSISSGKYNKSIIFIDEIDAIGGKRTESNEGGSTEYRNTLTALLTEMDGLDQNKNKNIIVIGATNTASFLDAALKRPGRFDRIVEIPMPDKESRQAILYHYTVSPKPRNNNLTQEDFALLAEKSYGLSAADLQALVNEAAIFALRDKVTSLTSAHFVQALKKIRDNKKAGG